MPEKSFRGKPIVVTIVLLVAIIVILNVFLSARMIQYSESLIDEKLNANISSLRLYLNDSMASSRASALSMSMNPSVIEAIKNRDTEEILRLTSQTEDIFRVNFFTVTDSEGIVLARMHEPENFGDSVLKQQNVQDAIAGLTSTYFEEGTVVKVSVRTGAPVYDDEGNLVGVISAGVRLDDDDILHELKDIFHSEVTVFFGDTRVATDRKSVV
jgi:methyl-accepting chemotaxis protein